MKIIFFGSDDFAAVSLQRLLQEGHEVAACVTPPDRAKGRGLKITPTPVKELAEKNSLPVLQPADVNDPALARRLKDCSANLFVVIAYGKILPEPLLNIPPMGAINIHASLLPKYRGAAPIAWALINGEAETGVSLIRMNARVDAGDIIAQKKIKIKEKDNAVILRAKLRELGAECLCQILRAGKRSFRNLKPQNEEDVTLAPRLTKDMGRISWDKSAKEIHDLIRGLLPWPGAYTSFHDKRLKILDSEVAKEPYDCSIPGTVCGLTKQGFVVAAGQSALCVKKVHLESSKAMEANCFMTGHAIAEGQKFG